MELTDQDTPASFACDQGPAAAADLSPQEAALIDRFEGSAPRYTSYPTAPHFTPQVGVDSYRQWLARLPEGAEISLYAHVPYCGTLCWFCACRTQGVRSYRPLERYLKALKKELRTVAALAPTARIRRIHWGGGSPTILQPDDIRGLADEIRKCFHICDDAEFAVEIDPRDMTEDRIDALADAGVTRASLGVQDFDPEVQKAINRIQSFEDTKRTLDGLRARGVKSVNIDALYGLPRQTVERCARTLEQVVELKPDRVALFGYAHVPWMSKRQQVIDGGTLPTSEERYRQAQLAAGILTGAGYVRVGLDHFALPGDDMAIAAAKGALRRNFQGYTTDTCDALIGVGASAIGRMENGYVQNIAPTAGYLAAIDEHGLATHRGRALTLDDQIRGTVIERLMCDLSFDRDALTERFGDLAKPVIDIADGLDDKLPEGLIERTPNGFTVTELGRSFLRPIAVCFDAYASDTEARYSRAV